MFLMIKQFQLDKEEMKTEGMRVSAKEVNAKDGGSQWARRIGEGVSGARRKELEREGVRGGE